MNTFRERLTEWLERCRYEMPQGSSDPYYVGLRYAYDSVMIWLDKHPYAPPDDRYTFILPSVPTTVEVVGEQVRITVLGGSPEPAGTG